MAVIVGIAIAYFFPGLARSLLNTFNRIKLTALAVVGFFVAIYFLSSGTWLFWVGFAGIILATWQFTERYEVL